MTTIIKPVSYLNRQVEGIRTTIGCTCGWMPAKAPKSGSTMFNAFKKHAKTVHDIDFIVCIDIIGEGPAKGMTFDEWYAIAPECDAYGERPCGKNCNCSTYKVTA